MKNYTLKANTGKFVLKDYSPKFTSSFGLPQVYYSNFLIYRDKYLENNSNSDLVMSYVLLQLTLENHFSYYLRFLIGGGIGRTIPEWNEMLYIHDINDKKETIKLGKLSIFYQYLKQNDFIASEHEYKNILNLYKEISEIRNLFAHGHPVTETNYGGKITISKAKDFLNRQKFNEICNKANTISNLWNKLMGDLQNQEQLLKKSSLPNSSFFDNCKFKIF